MKNLVKKLKKGLENKFKPFKPFPCPLCENFEKGLKRFRNLDLFFLNLLKPVGPLGIFLILHPQTMIKFRNIVWENRDVLFRN